MKKKQRDRKQIQSLKIIGRRLAGCLLAIAAGIFTACGQAKGEQRSIGIDGFVYMAREATISGENFMLSDIIAKDGNLYYAADSKLMRLSVEELVREEQGDEGNSREMGTEVLFQHIPSDYVDYSLENYAVGDDGDIYYCIHGYREIKGAWVPEEKRLLIRQAADGSLVYQMPFFLPEDEPICSLAVDGEGRAFLLMEEGISVVDASGTVVDIISTKDNVVSIRQDMPWSIQESFLEGPESRIYLMIAPGMTDNPVIYEVIVGDSCRLEQRKELTADMSGSFYGSPYGLLCNNMQEGILYQYSQTDSSWHPLLRWIDGNAGSNTNRVVQLTEDWLAANYFMAEKMSDTLYLFDRTAVAELPEKEVLVLATLLTNHTLENQVMRFNQANDRYHLQLEVYGGDAGAAERLDAALVSSNPPDLLDISLLDIVKYAQKQVLEDLYPYLDQSPTLSREEFLPNVLEGYTLDGSLCCIPKSFSLKYPVVGRPAQVGSKQGWTMKEIMELTENYPDCRLFDRNSFFSILDFCSSYILEEYIDWENGTCSFDSTQFQECIQWIWDHSEESGQVPAGEAYVGGFVPEDVLLQIPICIINPGDYGMQIACMGGELTIVGYPTVDGRFLQPVFTSGTCMVADSAHKEAAWQYIEFTLLEDVPSSLSSFPTRREALTQIVESETIPMYVRDQYGNISDMKDYSPRSTYRDQYGVPVYYYYLEREQADALMEIITQLDFAPQSFQSNTAYAILAEELEDWMTHGRSLEETATIIQNRMQLMLNEEG